MWKPSPVPGVPGNRVQVSVEVVEKEGVSVLRLDPREGLVKLEGHYFENVVVRRCWLDLRHLRPHSPQYLIIISTIISLELED